MDSLAALAAALACLAYPGIAGAYTSQQSGAEVRDYWTPERMETAIPGDALLSDAAAAVPVGDLDLGLGSDKRAPRSGSAG